MNKIVKKYLLLSKSMIRYNYNLIAKELKMKSYHKLEQKIKEEIFRAARKRGLKTGEEINNMLYNDFFSDEFINYQEKHDEDVMFAADFIKGKLYVKVWSY
jgi:hypothetical protein